MKDVGKIIKVVYFDENSAIDYLDIYNGGTKMKSSDKSTSISDSEQGDVGLKVKTGALFKALKPVIDITLEGGVKGEIGRIGESVIKTTVTNTLLSDYLDVAKEDKSVSEIKNYTVYAHSKSISFIKMYTPYLNMMKMENDEINFSKIDETLERSKGYYELVAENEENKQIILRFNIKAFRNNYNLVDITKMNLTFFSIKVGKMKLSQLAAESELDFKSNNELVTAAEIIGNENNENNKSNEINERDESVSFYDVILAGIIGYE